VVPPAAFSIGALTATDKPGATQAPTDRAANALTALTAPLGTLTGAASVAGTDSYPDIYYSDIYPAAPAATLTATDTRTGGPG
jgi:hypothetical protein